MIPFYTIDVDPTDTQVSVTARCGDKHSTFTVVKDRGTFLVREHGAGFSQAWLAVGYATKLATEAVLR